MTDKYIPTQLNDTQVGAVNERFIELPDGSFARVLAVVNLNGSPIGGGSSGGGASLSDLILTDTSGTYFIARDDGYALTYITLSGAAYTPIGAVSPSDKTLTNYAQETGGNLAAINSAFGTDGATPPTITGTGVRGWLRGAFEKLEAIRAAIVGGVGVTGTFWQATQPVSGTVAVTGVATEATLAAQSAKLPATLGQKAKDQSMSVVMASDYVSQGNVTNKFRESFESVDTTNTWLLNKASGDIVVADGNAVGASYLVLSLDPLTAGSVTTLETRAVFNMPVEVSVGAHMSQRTIGQEVAIELVSTDEPMVAPVDIQIASIQQATTTLTVTTLTAHGMKAGMRIGVYGCADSRLNYPSLVVATAPTDFQFTATGQVGGALPSVTAGPFASGSVYARSALGYAVDGASMIFENASATNASFYVRSQSGDVLPSGVATATHGITISTTASFQAVNAQRAYAFQPTSEYKLSAMMEAIQWTDCPVDSTTQSTSRVKRTQVVPSPSKTYKLRVRATNNAGLSTPVGQIVSVTKSGSTASTIFFDRPHGLTTADLVCIYGVRDQTAFANALTGVAPASIPSETSIIVPFGTTTTATSFGGYVSRLNGGNLPSAIGALPYAIQSASVVGGVLKLVANASVSGLLIGDYVNIVGVRNAVDGATLGIDGAWRATGLGGALLELDRVDGAAPADFASVNCGGAVIKRTDLRLSFVRVMDFQRDRVELMPRPIGDMSSAAPVVVQGGISAATQSGAWTMAGAGTPAAPATPYFVSSLATTNGSLVIAGTSGLQAFYATNTGASPAYVKLYNKATAPTVGTDIPEMVIPIPAAVAGVPGFVELTPGFNAYRFALGLGIAITGGSADADTTAVAAGQVKVKLSRTI